MGKKKMPEVNGIETARLNVSDVQRGLRVRIADNDSEHFGDIGMISSAHEGCSCRMGWCRVILDNSKRFPDGAREEFRYGYRGDVSDLLLITKEPKREPIPFLTKKNAKKDATVRVWLGSEENYRDARRGDGKIIAIEGRWATVRFKDGHKDDYAFGDNYQELILVAPSGPETESEKEARLKAEREEFEADKKGIGKKVTPAVAKEGARVQIAPDSDYKYQNRGVGTLQGVDVSNSNWIHVKFDDGYENAYRYGRGGGTSDLILVAPAPITE